MTLESAVEAILEQGKAEANRVLEEARNERQRMLSEVRAEAAKALAETEKAARIEAERKRVQELARAELESRKIVLAAQKEALDKVYDGASSGSVGSRITRRSCGACSRRTNRSGDPAARCTAARETRPSCGRSSGTRSPGRSSAQAGS